MIIVQKRINLPTANMGSRHSKRKYNKEGHKQKMCKIGLSLGRNQLKVEGNFQFGYHSEIDKKYEAVDAKSVVLASRFCDISTQGACFWRAAWTPRGNDALNLGMHPTPGVQ